MKKIASFIGFFLTFIFTFCILSQYGHALELQMKEMVGNSRDNYATNLELFGDKEFAIVGYTSSGSTGSSRYYAKFMPNSSPEIIDNWGDPRAFKYSYAFDAQKISDSQFYSVGHSLGQASFNDQGESLYSDACDLNGNDNSNILITEWTKGNSEWHFESNRIIGDKRDVARSVKKTSDNSLVLAGISNSTEIYHYVSGYENVIKEITYKPKLFQTLTNIIVAKVGPISPELPVQWIKFYGGPGIDEAENIYNTPDGGFIVVGHSTSLMGDVSGNKGKKDILLLKLDSNGNLVKKKSIGGPGNDKGYTLLEAPDGGYILCGTTDASGGDIPSDSYLGGTDIFIAKLDTNFNILWKKCVGGSGEDFAKSIIKISETEYMVAGYSNSKDGNVLHNAGDYDAFVFKMGINGNVLWRDTFGDANDDKAVSLKMNSMGDIFVVGNSNSNRGDFSGNHGGYDIFIVNFNVSKTLEIPIPAITAKDVETIENAGTIMVKNWARLALSDPSILTNHKLVITSDDPQNFSTVPFVDPQGYLVFSAKNNFVGTLFCSVSLVKNGSEAIPVSTKKFKIIISPFIQIQTLTAEDFSIKVDNYFNQIDINTGAEMLHKILDDFAKDLELAPSKNEMLNSFDLLLKTLKNKVPDLLSNSDVVFKLNNIAAKILELCCKIDVPSYLCNEKVGTVMTTAEIAYLETVINSNILVADKINKSFKENGILLKMESILKLKAKGIWNNESAYFEVPSQITKLAFTKGIKSVIVSTNVSTVCLKEPSLKNYGSKIMFLAEAKKLQDESVISQYNYNLYVDDVAQEGLVGYVSIWMPYENSSIDKVNSLTVFRVNDDGTSTNLGGIHNSFFNRMVFLTNHFSIYLIKSNTVNFTDTASTPWAESFISALAARGIVSGNENNQFLPSELVKRKEFATMIVNAFKLLDSNATSNFTDVLPADWSYPFVSSLVKLKIMKGYDATNFGGDNPIKKQDAAIVLVNVLTRLKSIDFLNNTEANTAIQQFVDFEDISSYAIPSVSLITATKVLKGDENKKFLPLTNMTRGQVSVAIYNALLLQSSQGLPYGLYAEYSLDADVS